MKNWDDAFKDKYPLRWHMAPAERLSLIALIDALRPNISIEVGTAQGGSLQVLAEYSKRVYALDLEQPQGVTPFPNVEHITGNSHETLPALLARLERFDFALIDGDHSCNGVRRDIEALIAAPPRGSACILMHDSFNPDVREGIKTAGWAASPYVHSVELDFVQGWFHTPQDGPGIDREMWGGFALAILGPEPRSGALVLRESQGPTYWRMLSVSAHRKYNIAIRGFRRLRRMMQRGLSRSGQE